MKILTIIVPCYNGEKYLPRCFNSLLGLDRDDVEVLFVNDGSNDLSKTMIFEWIKNTKLGRAIDKTNGGYPSAINCGLDNCKTKYVMFLGVDDEVVADEINRICNILRGNDLDILCFSTKKINEGGDSPVETIDRITSYKYVNAFDGSIYQLCKKHKEDANILFTRDTSKIFNTSTIGNIRLLGKTGVSSDGCFSSLVALKANAFFFTNNVCYRWHLHPDSVSGSKKSLFRLLDEVSVWKTFFSELMNKPLEEVPAPVIRMIRPYKNAVNSLKEFKKQEVINEHKRTIKDISRWLLGTKNLSFKQRVELHFPSLYMLFLKLLRK